MPDLIAPVLHEQKEVSQVVGVLNGLPQLRLQHAAEGGLPLGSAEPFYVAYCLGRFPLHDYRETMLSTQPVRDGPDLPVVALSIAVILLAGVRIDRVEEDVGVDVLLVYMDADDCLVAGQVL